MGSRRYGLMTTQNSPEYVCNSATQRQTIKSGDPRNVLQYYRSRHLIYLRDPFSPGAKIVRNHITHEEIVASQLANDTWSE